MRDLTQNEIEEYLLFARATRRRPPEFDQAQAEIIGSAFLNSGMMRTVTFAVAEHIIELSPEEISGTDILLSLLVWAFMLGRECESRLITNALNQPKAWTQ